MKSSQAIVPILFLLVSTVSATSTPPVQVSCSREEMKIEVDLTGRNVQDSKYTIYLDKLKHFPGCRMEMKSSTSGVLILPLDSDHLYSCGLTRLQNKVTGTKIFYHRLVIEERKRRSGSSSSPPSSSSHLSSSSASPSQSSSSLPPLVDLKDTRSNHTSRSSGSDHSHSNSASLTGHSTEEGHESFDHEDHGHQNAHHLKEGDSESEYTDITQEIMVVKCVIPGHHSRLVKRQSGSGLSFPIWELPDNFTESSEELIDFSGNVTARAPLPLLNIGVRQNGEFVDTALNVSPGTPLEMVIYLDEVSASVYGLLTSFLRVTDNTPRKQEEVIILNGCSIDPYIFANFETEDGGKSVSAKFRAFKFPDTNYVLFVGTVNVCIKSCLPVNCGEGIFGYGKRRRRRGADPRTSQLDGSTKLPQDPSKVFEAELSTFINVGYDSDLKSLPLQSKRDKLYQPVVTDTKVTYDIPSSHPSSSRNSKQYKNKQGKNNSTSLTTDPFIVSSIILFSFIVTVFVTESNLIRKY